MKNHLLDCIENDRYNTLFSIKNLFLEVEAPEYLYFDHCTLKLIELDANRTNQQASTEIPYQSRQSYGQIHNNLQETVNRALTQDPNKFIKYLMIEVSLPNPNASSTSLLPDKASMKNVENPPPPSPLLSKQYNKNSSSSIGSIGVERESNSEVESGDIQEDDISQLNVLSNNSTSSQSTFIRKPIILLPFYANMHVIKRDRSKRFEFHTNSNVIPSLIHHLEYLTEKDKLDRPLEQMSFVKYEKMLPYLLKSLYTVSSGDTLFHLYYKQSRSKQHRDQLVNQYSTVSDKTNTDDLSSLNAINQDNIQFLHSTFFDYEYLPKHLRQFETFCLRSNVNLISRDFNVEPPLGDMSKVDQMVKNNTLWYQISNKIKLDDMKDNTSQWERSFRKQYNDYSLYQESISIDNKRMDTYSKKRWNYYGKLHKRTISDPIPYTVSDSRSTINYDSMLASSILDSCTYFNSKVNTLSMNLGQYLYKISYLVHQKLLGKNINYDIKLPSLIQFPIHLARGVTDVLAKSLDFIVDIIVSILMFPIQVVIYPFQKFLEWNDQKRFNRNKLKRMFSFDRKESSISSSTDQLLQQQSSGETSHTTNNTTQSNSNSFVFTKFVHTLEVISSLITGTVSTVHSLDQGRKQISNDFKNCITEIVEHAWGSDSAYVARDTTKIIYNIVTIFLTFTGVKPVVRKIASKAAKKTTKNVFASKAGYIKGRNFFSYSEKVYMRRVERMVSKEHVKLSDAEIKYIEDMLNPNNTLRLTKLNPLLIGSLSSQSFNKKLTNI